MKDKDIVIFGDRIDQVERANSLSGKEFEIHLEGVDGNYLLDEFDIEEVADHFGKDLVEHIKKQHNLVEEQ